ncbi:MAG: eukaryotic-like serine/threonine-protein kinase [Actinoplanes sp.]|jgi:serine/threonine-protein kinase|nr:eukaryotic-like serine/threonine-protein kinase [Actinoplanes sp.]
MTAQARLLGGRYQVGELLGYGGMAEVHKGRDLRLGRDVAIKMLRTDLARDATFQERFRREAQNSAALNHPAIVAVYDTGEEISSTGEKLPFIVMEFVSGRTLKEVLAAEQRIQPRRALEITADICAALEFSHRHGIIHRDIKPANVMITPNGQVKVMDFGIARALASGATTMTQTSAVIGTAQYLSPEQARGESVDARSDVYAAGCVLFELIVGHPPFVGDSPVSVAYQHVREDPKAPSDINRDVPPEVDAIVLKALAKNPLNRYQSAQEMRADALRAVAGRPVLATPVMTEAETMAMTGPLRQPVGATTMTRPIPGGPPPRERERRSSWAMAVLAALAVLAVVALGVGLALIRDNNNKSRTPTTASMPDLKDKSDKQARALLTTGGFTNVTQGTPIVTDNCNNKVETQSPAAHTQTKLDAAVTYSLCKSPDKVPVPSTLKGAPRDTADAALKAVGLVPDFVEVSSTSPAGIVLDVEHEGDDVPPGSTITVKISKGDQVLLPDVRGKSQDGAQAILETAGFNVSVQTAPGTGTPGTVASQNPPGNKKVQKNSDVTIFVFGSPGPSESAPGPGSSQQPGANGLIGGLLN